MVGAPLIYTTGTPVKKPDPMPEAMPVREVVLFPVNDAEFAQDIDITAVQYEDNFLLEYQKNSDIQKFDQALDAQLNMQSILIKIDSALSIWATPEGRQLESQLKGSIGRYNEIITSLRDTYRNITTVLLDFRLLDSAQPNSTPVAAVDWAVSQLEWIQWQAIEAYWNGDRSAGSYAITSKDILTQYRSTLLRWQSMLEPITGVPADPGTGLPPADPGAPTPPAPGTSNKNILLIGAAGLALLLFLYKRK